MSDTNDSRPSSIPWRGESVSRVMLGTVQLGMDYGIARVQERPGRSEAQAIIEEAWAGGIRHFDTAQAYGESEAVLGECLRAMGVSREARVASKLDASLDPLDIDAVAAAIDRTFDRLGVDRLWCMLLHDPAWLDRWDDGLGALLLEQREAGRIQHLGVSVFAPDQAQASIDHPDVEIIQAACNAWDRRPARLGVFDRAHAAGMLVCVRSIYLQGLLTMPPEAVRDRLPIAENAAREWCALAQRHGVSLVELAVRFALGLGVPLVIGAESPAQIRHTLELIEKEPLDESHLEDIAATLDPVLSDRIVDPWRWGRD